jgi:uncharacterized protein DUF4384
MQPVWIFARVATWCVVGLLGVQVSLASSPLDPVTGRGCYVYGDNETPALARRAAVTLAQEEAVRSHHVYVRSVSTVQNFQLRDDVIQTASAGMLENVRITKEEKKDQQICVTLTGRMSAVKLEGLIHQKAKAQEVADAAQTAVLTEGSAFELKVWTNKPASEVFVEGEELVLSVRSNRTAFLKLDYYQADGTVVHLVPNFFMDDAVVHAQKIYTFGGKGSRFAFRIKGPFGAETIKAVASTGPLDTALASAKDQEDSQDYVKTFHATMRGVRLEAREGVQPQWAEASVALKTVSKGLFDHREFLATLRGRR